MNPRVTTIVVGGVTLALGLAGLLYPDRVMGLLGFAVLSTAKAAAVLGEIRAVYGGLFIVLGIYTLLAGFDPPAHRSRLMFIGFLWLGVCAGRLIGANVDGNPGLPGWLAAAVELLFGGLLVAASFIARSTTSDTYAPPAPPPPTPASQP